MPFIRLNGCSLGTSILRLRHWSVATPISTWLTLNDATNDFFSSSFAAFFTSVSKRTEHRKDSRLNWFAGPPGLSESEKEQKMREREKEKEKC